MHTRMIIAGSGGQGVLMLGKLLAQAGMDRQFHVTYLPSYGAEVRGGTAHCHVAIADQEIYSPLVEQADVLIIMNQPSYTRFRPILKPGGLLLANSSLTDSDADRDGRREVRVPASDVAAELGNVRVANVVMLGAFCRLVPILTHEDVSGALQVLLTGTKAKLLPLNEQALSRGAALVET